MISRRALLKGVAAIGAAGTGTCLYTWLVEPHWLEVVRRPLSIVGLPADLEGATLVQISDVHAGPSVADGYVEETFAQVRALDPDLVVYTGDFASYHPEIFEQMERVYADPPRGRLGTVGILGNHDYGPNWAHPEIAARLAGLLQARGIRVLRNEVADFAGLQIIGLDDLWAGRFDAEQGMALRDPARPAVVLTHNPDTVDRAGWGNFAGWILAGHTHGGQCKPPFLAPPLLPVENRRYTSGPFDLSGGRTLYVSRGVGHLLQVRFNVRPEVTVFDLQPASPVPG